MSQYPKFLGYMFVPLGIIGFSLLVAFGIVHIRMVEDAMELKRKEAEAERKRKIRLANKGLKRNYYGIAKAIDDEEDSDSESSDDDMQPRALAQVRPDNVSSSSEEEAEDLPVEEVKPNEGIEIKKPKVAKPAFKSKINKPWEAEPKKVKKRTLEDPFECVLLFYLLRRTSFVDSSLTG